MTAHGNSRPPPAWPSLVLLLAALPGHAVDYCVSTATGLQSALTAAAASTADDTIRLVQGTYRTTLPLGFRATLTTTGDLAISGGWSFSCQGRVPGGRSTIDGESLRPGLTLLDAPDSGGLLRVEWLSFVNGFTSGSESSGGLTAGRTWPNGLAVEIEHCRFVNNVADHPTQARAGALYSLASQSLSVRNNVFLRNQSQDEGGAAHLICGGGISDFINNTVYDNSAGLGAASDNGGLKLSGFLSCPWEVASNIIWGNEGIDLVLATDAVILRNNNVGDLGGAFAPNISTNNSNVDPQFVSAGVVRLRRSSPMIDAGLDAPLTGLSAQDHDGGPRRVLPQVDVGAYEYDVLLAHDFDPPFSGSP